MKPKTIGLIGGAGPLAGVFLMEQLFQIARQSYGCYRDSDFPKVLLISFPFTEMLSEKVDENQVKHELQQCLKDLRYQGAQILAIACNTLHAFLDESDNQNDLVHLPKTLASEISKEEIPIIMCTSTSVRFALHKKYFPCVYPSSEDQKKVDQIIEKILKGTDSYAIKTQLRMFVKQVNSPSIVLGCTELSLFAKDLKESGKKIIDPLQIIAKKIILKSFLK